MRVNLKRLTDAVPELMELEFIAEDTAILISTTLTIEQAKDLYTCLSKAIAAHIADQHTASPADGATCGMGIDDHGIADHYGLQHECYNGVVSLLRFGAHNKIQAIKLIRAKTNMFLKESKEIADAILEEIKKGKL